PFSKTSLQVHVQHSNEIEHGFTEIANQMHAIDLECYSHLPGFAQVDIPRGLSTEWTKFNPDIYTILIDELADRVVGYTNTIPLREETFRKILNGEQDDSKISGHHVVPFDTGESIYLYFMSIVIEPGARRMNQGIYQEAFELLLSAVEAKILDYYRLFGTKVIEIGAVGWTVEGRQLCEALGL